MATPDYAQLQGLERIVDKHHKVIMALVAQAEEKLTRAEVPRSEALSHLIELQEALTKHFAAEEKSPLYAIAPELFPDLATDLHARRDEHAGFLAQLQRGVAGLATGTSALADAVTVARVRMVLAAIGRHEAQEHVLAYKIGRAAAKKQG